MIGGDTALTLSSIRVALRADVDASREWEVLPA